MFFHEMTISSIDVLNIIKCYVLLSKYEMTLLSWNILNIKNSTYIYVLRQIIYV